MDLKAEARRLADEAESFCEGADGNVLIILGALLAFGRLVREEDAKVCDVEAKIRVGQTASPRDPAIYEQGIGCEICAKEIRTKALE